MIRKSYVVVMFRCLHFVHFSIYLLLLVSILPANDFVKFLFSSFFHFIFHQFQSFFPLLQSSSSPFIISTSYPLLFHISSISSSLSFQLWIIFTFLLSLFSFSFHLFISIDVDTVSELVIINNINIVFCKYCIVGVLCYKSLANKETKSFFMSL